MFITHILLENFRNFLNAELKPHANLNLIFGANGAGKSSLLEVLHVLVFGRSFRTSKSNNIINENAKIASGCCKITTVNSEEETRLGISR